MTAKKPTKKKGSGVGRGRGSSPSLSSLAKLLASASPDMSGVEQAQELIYQAWQAGSAAEARELAERALALSADCADAYSLLADLGQRLSPTERLALYREGVKAGERALGERLFEECAGHFWGFIETRPYMRARQRLADLLWREGMRTEAVDHYRDMLRLNPNDNQGIRHTLLPCLVALGLDQEAERLFGKYDDDATAGWSYARALLDFRASGDSPKAFRSLQEALRANPHVATYLLGRKELPLSEPDSYMLGSEEEAVICVLWSHSAWMETPRALAWLATREK